MISPLKSFKLKQKLEFLDKNAIIIFGGDHNCTLNSTLDRQNCAQVEGDAVKKKCLKS